MVQLASNGLNKADIAKVLVSNIAVDFAQTVLCQYVKMFLFDGVKNGANKAKM